MNKLAFLEGYMSKEAALKKMMGSIGNVVNLAPGAPAPKLAVDRIVKNVTPDKPGMLDWLTNWFHSSKKAKPKEVIPVATPAPAKKAAPKAKPVKETKAKAKTKKTEKAVDTVKEKGKPNRFRDVAIAGGSGAAGGAAVSAIVSALANQRQ